MAATANSLRLCLRTCSQTPCLQANATQTRLLRRALSTASTRWAAEKKSSRGAAELAEEHDRSYRNPGDVLKVLKSDEKLPNSERAQAAQLLEEWNQLPRDKVAEYEQLTKEISGELAALKRPARKKKASFWNTNEPDSDMITDEIGEDDFEEDDMLSLGHGKLEEHREYREYARITVWEMPLLSKLAKPFEPPQEDQVLRFRFTNYMGEFHPADRKVVVEFCPKDLKGLTEVQQSKLMKLAGARYNPEKEIIRMSCEQFEHQAQNKRYLGDLVDKMIAAAKDPTDTFEDIPLDTRHHKFKVRHRFPKEWLLTEERREELEGLRKKAYLLDEGKRANGGLVDGTQTIQEALASGGHAILQPVMAGRGSSRSGKAQMR